MVNVTLSYCFKTIKPLGKHPQKAISTDIFFPHFSKINIGLGTAETLTSKTSHDTANVFSNLEHMSHSTGIK